MGGGRRAIFKALLLAGVLAAGGLTGRPAEAYSVRVATSGTITSGSEAGGAFGLPAGTTSLVGDLYTLSVTYDFLGPNYFTDGTGTFASDFESLPGVPGRVTATVNGVPLTTNLTNSLGSTLVEDLFDLNASNVGYDGSGNFVSVSQTLSCASSCVPFADLQTPFSYTLQPGDVGTDLYTFQSASFPAPGSVTATFTGTEVGLSFPVPEPESWSLLAFGLLGLGLLTRRRRA